MKKIFIYKILPIIYLLFLSVHAFSQKATLKGKISDSKTKEGLPNAYVLYNGTGIGTDLEGNFSLELDPGVYDLKFQFIGYITANKKVTLVANETKEMNIALEEEVKTLGTVVVTGGKYEQKIEEVTMSMDVIRPDLTTDKGATNIQGAINQSPGVQIVDNQPQIRGGSGFNFGAGSRVMILIDDIPLLDGGAGRPQWSFFPLENLEQIEVLKGASSVLYGSSALSGVINIRTAYPKDKPMTKVVINSGIYDVPKRDYAKSWTSGNNPSFTNLSFFHSRKVGNLDVVFGVNLFSDEHYIGSEPDRITIKRINSTNVAVLGPISSDTIRATGGDTTFQNLSGESRNFERRARANLNLRYRFKNIEGLSIGLNTNVMIKQDKGTLMVLDVDSGLYRNYPGSSTLTKSTPWYVDPFLNYVKKNSKHSLRTRFYHANNINTNNQSNAADLGFIEYQYYQKIVPIDLNMTVGAMSSFAKSVAELYRANEDSSGESTAHNNAVYIQLEKKFFNKLNISTGARYERFKINDDEQARPVFRAGLNYHALKATYFRASWGQGYRFPTIAEKYIRTSVGPLNIFPNYNLRPESSWNAEVGVKQGFKIGNFMGFVDIVGFRQEVTDAIEFNFGVFGNETPVTIFNISRNIGFKSLNISKSRIQGYEFAVAGQGNIGNVKIAVLSGFTQISPMNLSPQEIVDTSITGVPVTYEYTSTDSSGILKYRFENMIKNDVQITYKKFTIGISYRYLSYMKNIDNIFYWADKGSGVFPFDGLLPTGIKNYREERNGKGDSVIDARIIYEINDMLKASIICDNLLNHEYMIRPLLPERPRVVSVQFTWTM